MAKTIIDQLVVTLGLDPTEYNKGKAAADAAQRKLKRTAQEEATATETAGKKSIKTTRTVGTERKRQSEAERKRTRQSDKDRKTSTELEKKLTEGTLSRLKNLGVAAGAAVLGFKTLEGAIAAYAATSGNLANLGRLAPSVGTSAADINTLGNALKQVGGNQADANADLMKIAQAQFSWQMHNPDQFASMARNLGVGLFDSRTGKLRSKVDILTDIGKRLRSMTPDTQAQAMYARQMGLSEASIQLFVLDQARTRRQILKDAQETNRVTKQGVDLAIAASTQWNRMKNRVQGVKDTVVQATESNAVTAMSISNSKTATWGDKIAAWVVAAVGGFTPADALGPQGGAPAKYAGAFQAADKKYGLQPGTLESIAWQESRFNPKAKSKRGAVGMMQLEPHFFKGAGKNPLADIDTAGAEFSRLLKVYHGDYAAALDAYNFGQGNYDKYRHGVIKRLPKETAAYAPSVLGHMPGAVGAAATSAAMPSAPLGATAAGSASAPTASNTSVEIDNINVYTQAKDANGIAAALPEALRRKGVVATANQGLS